MKGGMSRALLLLGILLAAVGSAGSAGATDLRFYRINDCRMAPSQGGYVCVWDFGRNRTGNIFAAATRQTLKSSVVDALRRGGDPGKLLRTVLAEAEQRAIDADRRAGVEIIRSDIQAMATKANFSKASACIRFDFNTVGYGQRDARLKVFSTGIRCAYWKPGEHTVSELLLIYTEVFPYSEAVSKSFKANAKRVIDSLVFAP